jgi:hypothetical protein
MHPTAQTLQAARMLPAVRLGRLTLRWLLRS